MILDGLVWVPEKYPEDTTNSFIKKNDIKPSTTEKSTKKSSKAENTKYSTVDDTNLNISNGIKIQSNVGLSGILYNRI